MKIETTIKDLIRNNGPISISRYMEICLWDNENGYYTSNEVFGGKGDFITSPEVSQTFGELIGLWAFSFYQKFISRNRLCITELGSGRGTLLKDAIRAIYTVTNKQIDLDITILEKSQRLVTLQKENLRNNNVRWISDIKKLSSEPQIIIANEFFDALPIKQFFKINNKWIERYVKSDKKNNKSFVNIDIDIKKIEKKLGFKISSNQKVVEYSPVALEYLKSISKKINNKKGALLIIDYGYLEDSMKDTLMAIRKHTLISIFKEFKNFFQYFINCCFY